MKNFPLPKKLHKKFPLTIITQFARSSHLYICNILRNVKKNILTVKQSKKQDILRIEDSCVSQYSQTTRLLLVLVQRQIIMMKIWCICALKTVVWANIFSSTRPGQRKHFMFHHREPFTSSTDLVLYTRNSRLSFDMGLKSHDVPIDTLPMPWSIITYTVIHWLPVGAGAATSSFGFAGSLARKNVPVSTEIRKTSHTLYYSTVKPAPILLLYKQGCTLY